MYDPNKYKASRAKPLQARGKERVRIILATSLALFKERGLESVTTNEIAERAHIPIGSLYRYYPNKDAIIMALTELYVDDLSAIFIDIGRHPMLKYLSWDEVLLLMVDAWVNYSRLNGPFAFLYAEKSNPRLHAMNRHVWQTFIEAFGGVLTARCPQITERQVQICFQLSLAAGEIGISGMQEDSRAMCHEATGAVSAYMLRICKQHKHDA